MAVLFNTSKRGFILKEGFLAPNASLKVSKEVAEMLVRLYPGELKMITVEDVKEDVKEDEKKEEKKADKKK